MAASHQSVPAASTVGRALLHNEEVGAVFDEMADLLGIQGENTFRVRAYRRVALCCRISRQRGVLRSWTSRRANAT